MLDVTTPHFSIDLTVLTAASLLPSASYIKWAVFFVCFYSRHFGVAGGGVGGRRVAVKKPGRFFDGTLPLMCIKTKNACHPEG